MKIDFEGRTYNLHYSFRIGFLYEQIQQKPIDFSNLTQYDLVLLFYCTFLATLQYNKVNNHMTFEDFLNWVDDNGQEKMVVDFTNWYVDTLKQQSKLLAPKEDNETGDTDPNF